MRHSPNTPRPRRAFTVIELLVVMSVMAVIAGSSFLVLTAVKAKANRDATNGVLRAVSAAIASYGQTVLRCRDASGNPSYERPIWDLDGNGILDGDPQLMPSLKSIAPVGFRGLVKSAGLDLPRHLIDSQSQVLDSWKRPLQIGFAARIYGTSLFGVCSLGPDGKPGTADDLFSWKEGVQ